MEVISMPANTKVKDSIELSPIFSDISKYRDPLHLLLDYITEVRTSTTGLVSCLCCHNTPGLNVNYVASI